MANVSRPLVALLLGTVVFFGLYIVALKPSGPGSGGSSQGLGAYSSAITAAHSAAATSARATAAESGAPAPRGTSAAGGAAGAGTAASTGAGTPAAQATSGAAASQGTATSASRPPASPAKPSMAIAPAGQPGSAQPSPSTAAAVGQSGPAELKAALAAHEVVLLLFYNPAGADDQAVKQELDALHVPADVLVQIAPVSQLAAYSSITEQVPVSQSPTLLFIDRHGQASSITGFVDALEITQQLADTLAAK